MNTSNLVTNEATTNPRAIVTAQETSKTKKAGRPPKSKPDATTDIDVTTYIAAEILQLKPKSAEYISSTFNLNSLRLSQNFGDILGVKKLLMRVPVRKPNKTDFFRVNADENYRMPVMILEIKDENETYVLMPEVYYAIPELAKPAMLYAAIDRRNNVFLIPVPLPGPDGRRNQWHQSLDEVVGMSMNNWVRIAANLRIGGYDVHVAEASLAEPEWPDATFEKLVEIAFKGRVIDTLEHPVIRQLLGGA